MTIYIPIGIISFILAAFIIAIRQRGNNKVLQKRLELTSNDDEYFVNSFNRSDFRSTTISEENGLITLNSDIQIIQLTTNGKLKLRVSSDLDSMPVKFELLTKFDPKTVDPNYINDRTIDKVVAFPYRNEATIDILKYLQDNYELELEQIIYSPCIGIVYGRMDINKSRKTIEINGTLKDNNKWEIFIDYDKNRIRFKFNQDSLKDKNNFPKYILDYIDS